MKKLFKYIDIKTIICVLIGTLIIGFGTNRLFLALAYCLTIGISNIIYKKKRKRK